MASILVQTTDFTGFYKINQTTQTTAVLQSFIDKNEKSIIRRLLGLELGDLFIADVAAFTPVTARYLALFNPIAIQISGLSTFVDDYYQYGNGHIYESRGMKEIILGMLYDLYVTDQQHLQSQSGVVRSEVDAAKALGFDNAARQGETRHNSIIDDYEAVQYFARTEAATYPEYDGLRITVKYSAII